MKKDLIHKWSGLGMMIDVWQLERKNEVLETYINTIFDYNTRICNKLDIEDVKFYCEYKKDYVDIFCRDCEADCKQIGLFEEISSRF